jgi:hypothetical protein
VLCRAKREELGHDTLHEVLALESLLFRLELNAQLEEGLVEGLPLLRAAQTRCENEADEAQHEIAEASIQPLASRRRDVGLAPGATTTITIITTTTTIITTAQAKREGASSTAPPLGISIVEVVAPQTFL